MFVGHQKLMNVNYKTKALYLQLTPLKGDKTTTLSIE